MEIEQTAAWADIRKIINDTAKPVRYNYTGTIHTVEGDIQIEKISTIDIVRDYVNNVGDTIFIEFIMPQGTYARRLFPYRANLELTLTREHLLEVGERVDDNAYVEKERYKAVFLVNENLHIKGSDVDKESEISMNTLSLIPVKLQLLNRSLEALRIKTTGGVFKNVDFKDLIRGVLLGESKRVIIDGKPAVDGLDLVQPDNTDRQKQLVIPHGTMITSLPTWIQEKDAGLYAGGVGTYLQSYNNQRLWFVYPLFKATRFKDNIKKIIFYGLSEHRYPNIERTYRKEGDILYVAITGKKTYTDTGEADLMSNGSGFRMMDARTIMGKPVKMTEDGPVASRHQVNHEVAIKARADNLNYVPLANEVISRNPFVQFSRVLQRAGGRIDLTWENAAFWEIYPGMPCQYVFVDEGELKMVEAVVLFNHTSILMEGQGVLSKSFRSISRLTLYANALE